MLTSILGLHKYKVYVKWEDTTVGEFETIVYTKTEQHAIEKVSKQIWDYVLDKAIMTVIKIY